MGDSEENVHTFLAFTQAPSRHVAKVFLKNNNNDLERAANAYFENPDPSRYESQISYDESSWSGDRYGQSSHNDTVMPFLVDDGNESHGPSGAPTRPPSRTNDNPGTAASFSYIPGDPGAGDSTFGQQETGVIETAGQEYIPDVEPKDRTRLDNEPVFMKPLPSQEFLPSLVTILASISQFRNAIFDENLILSDYGYNQHWWEGDTIQKTRIVVESGTTEEPPEQSVLHEMQRLMAFLDYTQRAYGSVGALARLCPPDRTAAWTTDASLGEVLRCLDDTAARLVSTRDGSALFTSKKADSEASMWDQKEFQIIDLNATAASDAPVGSLYDHLNDFFWSGNNNWADNSDELSNMQALETIAPILIITIPAQTGFSPSPKLIIPDTWFADRYMASNLELVSRMREEVRTRKLELEDVENRLSKIETSKAITDGKLKGSLAMLSTISNHINNQNVRDESGTPEAHLSSDVNRDARILESLGSLTSHLGSRIAALSQERHIIQANIEQASRLFIEPSSCGKFAPLKRYRLIGVAKHKAGKYPVTFAAKKRDNSEAMNGETSDLCFWRFSYETAMRSATFDKKEISKIDVLQAAGDGTEATLLVYASDASLEASEAKDVPGPLKEFVKRDNEQFRAELSPGIEVIEGQAPDDAEDSPALESVEFDGAAVPGNGERGKDEAQSSSVDITMHE